jgi:hypothetical protein
MNIQVSVIISNINRLPPADMTLRIVFGWVFMPSAAAVDGNKWARCDAAL